MREGRYRKGESKGYNVTLLVISRSPEVVAEAVAEARAA